VFRGVFCAFVLCEQWNIRAEQISGPGNKVEKGVRGQELPNFGWRTPFKFALRNLSFWIGGFRGRGIFSGMGHTGGVLWLTSTFGYIIVS